MGSNPAPVTEDFILYNMKITKISSRRITKLPDESLRKGLSEASEKTIVDVVLEKSGFTLEEISSKTRKQDIVIARHLIAYFGTVNMYRSTIQIGILCKKNHATVLNSRKAIENWIISDHNMKLIVIKLAQLIIKYKMKERIQLIGKVKDLPLAAARLKFKEAQKSFEEKGYDVWNPMEHVPLGISRGEEMRICLNNLVNGKVDAIGILPDWVNSEGSQVEYMVANALGLKEIRL